MLKNSFGAKLLIIQLTGHAAYRIAFTQAVIEPVGTAGGLIQQAAAINHFPHVHAIHGAGLITLLDPANLRTTQGFFLIHFEFFNQLLIAGIKLFIGLLVNDIATVNGIQTIAGMVAVIRVSCSTNSRQS